MAKINLKDSGKFTSMGGDYFTLKDDGDMARVRFLYDDPTGADIDYFLVHEVKYKNANGKEVRRYVSCLGVDDEGRMHKDDCPLCKAGVKTVEKLYLQLYDEADDTVKIWERGKNFVGKIITFLNRYGTLVSQPIEIERKGKKGDQQTTYEMFALEKDGKTLQDFPEKLQVEGTFIVKASKQDMIDMLNENYNWGGNNNQSNNTSQRAPQQQEYRQEQRQPRRTRIEDEF